MGIETSHYPTAIIYLPSSQVRPGHLSWDQTGKSVLAFQGLSITLLAPQCGS